MNDEQRTGTLIVAVAVTLIIMTLVLSQGWGAPPGVGLFINVQYGDTWLDSFTIYSRWILAPLVAVAGYGVVRYFSLIPPIFRRQGKADTLKSE